ncbi:MAG: UDP-3-O-(3-hydroxymyristoyl)glucosamine N-acyltransferase [Chthoniobacterales bacterium]
MKKLTLQEIAGATEGQLQGDSQRQITGAATLVEATEGEISFFANPRYAVHLRATRASAVFVPMEFAEEIPNDLVRVKDPFKAFEQTVRQFAPPPVHFAPGIHPGAVVDPSAKIGEGVSVQACAVVDAGASIGPRTVVCAGSYIGQETIVGADCMIYPNVTIRERSRIGDRVIIHAGTVVGADGFGFDPSQGRYLKQPQIGIVQIDDDVEIGANCAIDRARFGRTWIQKGVKIDNLVHLAHNVVIGENTVMAAQVGIAGSTHVGKRVIMGGGVGVVGHIEIGDDTILGARTGVSKSISGGTWWGRVAAPLHEAKQQIVWVRNLGKLFARVRALEKKVGE